MRDAPVDEIEEAIRPGGISKVKSARIKAILRAITETAPQHAPRTPPAPSTRSLAASTPSSLDRLSRLRLVRLLVAPATRRTI